MDFRLYRLMYRLYLASSPRTTISVWALYWVVSSSKRLICKYAARFSVCANCQFDLALQSLRFFTRFDVQSTVILRLHIYMFFCDVTAYCNVSRKYAHRAARCDLLLPSYVTFVRIKLESSLTLLNKQVYECYVVSRPPITCFASTQVFRESYSTRVILHCIYWDSRATSPL